MLFRSTVTADVCSSLGEFSLFLFFFRCLSPALSLSIFCFLFFSSLLSLHRLYSLVSHQSSLFLSPPLSVSILCSLISLCLSHSPSVFISLLFLSFLLSCFLALSFLLLWQRPPSPDAPGFDATPQRSLCVAQGPLWPQFSLALHPLALPSHLPIT